MKQVPAIVERHIDVDALERRLVQAITGEADAERATAQHEKLAAESRAAATLRRIEVGKILLEARAEWPERGPGAKGWGDFLRRVGMAESTAKLRMDQARDPEGFRRTLAKTSTSSDIDEDDDGQTGPRIVPAGREPNAAPFRQLSEQDLVQALARLDPDAKKRVLKAGKANLQGNSGDVERGTWTTSAKWAKAIGPVMLDPFSNDRSLVESVHRCMLEDGGDGFGGGEPGETPGLYLLGERHGSRTGIATSETTVFWQWPYSPGFAERAIIHYRHTRFRALLRWSPDTAWFKMMWPLVSTIAIPQERIEFDPPPGVPRPESTISYPHALYYANWRDVTDEVRALCIVIAIDHATTDPRAIQPAIGL